MCLIFAAIEYQRKFINDENFLIYGIYIYYNECSYIVA